MTRHPPHRPGLGIGVGLGLTGDLFDHLPEVADARRAAHARPLVDALTCLRDAVPEALEVLVHLGPTRTGDTRKPRASGAWAYCVSHAGLRHEPVDHWWMPTDGGRAGWDRTPAHLATWDQLCDLLADDPRRADVTAWASSLTAVDRWRDLTRPHELWPEPDRWHPSYIQADHDQPGWDQRLTAWRTVQSILTDTITTLTAPNHPTPPLVPRIGQSVPTAPVASEPSL